MKKKVTRREFKRRRAKLVKFLRENSRKQCSGALARSTKGDEPKNFCVLGAACEVYRRNMKRGKWRGFYWMLDMKKECRRYIFRVGRSEGSAYLPPAVIRYFNFTDCKGSFNDSSLVDLNDDNSLSFRRLATLIEKEPEGLFKDAAR